MAEAAGKHNHDAEKSAELGLRSERRYRALTGTAHSRPAFTARQSRYRHAGCMTSQAMHLRGEAPHDGRRR